MGPSSDLSVIEAALARGDTQAAMGLAYGALRRGVRHPLVLRLAAAGLAERGGYGDALSLFTHAAALDPADASLRVSQGICLDKLGRPADAAAAYRAALALDPNNALAHGGLAACLAALSLVDLALKHFAQAVRLDPGSSDAQAGYAAALVGTGDAAGARTRANRALAKVPDHPVATLALARAENALGHFPAAEAAARRGLAAPAAAADAATLATLSSALGDSLHGQKRAREAFRAYADAARARARAYAAQFQASAAELAAVLAGLTERFSRLDEAAWSQPPAERASDREVAAGHVFLVGFPRSGTTLFEQILAAHPDVAALDEAPTLVEAETVFLRTAGGLDALAALDEGTAARHRDAYWRVVRAAGVDPGGKVFVDKMPLSSISLPIIAKLFPRARVVFALRDPRDVILSCFRQDFRPNGATFRFLDLADAAAFYDSVMGLAELYRPVLPLPIHDLRYEAVVDDFEGEIRAACAFIGVDWREELHAFAGQSNARAIVTPSAAQVRKGLYRGGEGQWRAYREDLGPVLPVLAPWVERFGYAPD